VKDENHVIVVAHDHSFQPEVGGAAIIREQDFDRAVLFHLERAGILLLLHRTCITDRARKGGGRRRFAYRREDAGIHGGRQPANLHHGALELRRPDHDPGTVVRIGSCHIVVRAIGPILPDNRGIDRGSGGFANMKSARLPPS
jgi:hypothetical protein